jgi:hypothetical protein
MIERLPDSVVPGQAVTADWANRQRDHAVASRFVCRPGSGFRSTSGGVQPPTPALTHPLRGYATRLPEACMPWSLFRLSIDGMEVTIGKGLLLRGGAPLLYLGSGKVTIAADNQYAAWKVNPLTNELTVDPDPWTDFPAQKGGFVYGPLYQFSVLDSDDGPFAVLLMDYVHAPVYPSMYEKATGTP